MRLKNELLPHQLEAIEKLRNLKVGALFMEQGTGKSITALELCRLRLETGKVEKIIWLCPCSAKENLKNEILFQADDAMLPNIVICGIESLSLSIPINTYLLTLVQEYKCFLVIDESLLVKNPDAIRTANIIRLSGYCSYKLILNGTQISRNEADLFAQFYCLDWRILGYKSYWSFAANHLEMDPLNPQKIRHCLNIESLIKKVGPYSYQVLKKDCLKLPDKTYHSYYFDMTDEQEAHYSEISSKLLLDLDEFRPETIYRLFTALQLIVTGKRIIFITDHDGMERFHAVPFFDNPFDDPRLNLLLDKIDWSKKYIIFCTFTSDIITICNVLNSMAKETVAYPFNGSWQGKSRYENVRKFKTEGKFLVANQKSASYSLNLQVCSNIIFYNNSWDLAMRLQGEDRVHRIGQINPVKIEDIIAINSIDQKIKQCLVKKEKILDTFKAELAQYGQVALNEWFDNTKKKRYKCSIYDCSDLEDPNA